ncbi:uncharacterized protein DUF4440 [Luteimonas cucumeris]|uniref:Uncharacterized protein DUF4440 n=1 Tax=Luteimonas cucumeris TaxID=985012 RepID=A0A562LEW2_9GAMM|nr:DUF4440 domain-containing protein [Luteimonas cucumeris]TWI06150.1 uncharacterized protein DUF4440 [Luteimonas cucumeris]
MNLAEQLENLESGFWTGTRQYYEEHLATESIAAYPEPAGVMSRARILQSIQGNARWTHVDLEDFAMRELAPGVALVTYRAVAVRNDREPPYRALVGSLYLRQDSAWKLAFNQQTPLPDEK